MINWRVLLQLECEKMITHYFRYFYSNEHNHRQLSTMSEEVFNQLFNARSRALWLALRPCAWTVIANFLVRRMRFTLQILYAI